MWGLLTRFCSHMSSGGDKTSFTEISAQLYSFWEGVIGSFESHSVFPSTCCYSIYKSYTGKAHGLYLSRSFLSPVTRPIPDGKLPSLITFLMWNKNNTNGLIHIIFCLNDKDDLTDFLSVKVISSLLSSMFPCRFWGPWGCCIYLQQANTIPSLNPWSSAMKFCFKYLEGKNRCCHFSSAHFFSPVLLITRMEDFHPWILTSFRASERSQITQSFSRDCCLFREGSTGDK